MPYLFHINTDYLNMNSGNLTQTLSDFDFNLTQANSLVPVLFGLCHEAVYKRLVSVHSPAKPKLKLPIS